MAKGAMSEALGGRGCTSWSRRGRGLWLAMRGGGAVQCAGSVSSVAGYVASWACMAGPGIDVHGGG